MKRTFTTIVCLSALALAACSSESNFPQPSGKGRISAVNAIPASSEVDFRIEERTLGTLPYKAWASPISFDDFEYNFNFDIRLPGQVALERIATVLTKIDVNRDYMFVLTGDDVTNPTITTWVTDVRAWNASETVFEARFSHLSQSLGTGDIDVYFADATTVPMAGEQVATLSFGDVMDPTEFAEGSYVITITEAGNVNNVYFTSSERSFGAAASHTLAFLDADANDTAPYLVTSMAGNGITQRFADPAYDSTIRFVHAAKTLQDVDVYEDEVLTMQLTSDVTFGVPTSDLPIATEEKTYYFTPAGSVATTLFSQPASAPPEGQHTTMYLIGDTDAWGGVYVTLDRSPSTTFAKLRIFHGAFNNSVVNFYLLPRGETITEDDVPRIRLIGYGLLTASQELAEGSYDIYAAEISDQTVLGGPWELDVVNGDVVFLQIVDTDDPATVEFQDVSIP